MNDRAVEAVARSIRQFGFRAPIIVDGSDVIVTGHTRWKAAMKLGLEEVPVIVAADLTEAQARAYRIADNKLAELAQWDTELLLGELPDLRAGDLDLTVLGFSDRELADLLESPSAIVQDQAPQLPDKPITQPGDLWIMGDHRLLCGDAASQADVDRLLGGDTPIHLVNTDPPYNVQVEPRSNNAIAAGVTWLCKLDKRNRARMNRRTLNTTQKMRAKDRPLANDFLPDEEFAKLILRWFGQIARVLPPGRSFYVWGGYSNLGNYPTALKVCGLHYSEGIVWAKNHPVPTRKDFMHSFEVCFYGWREGAGHKFFGPNNATDLWHVKKVQSTAMVHLTEKPVELAVRAIQYSSRPGENVLDLFGGSGSTLIGAQQTGRRAFLMEIDTAYCDVIVQRWEAFTQQSAERARSTDVGPGPGVRTDGIRKPARAKTF